MPLYEYTCNKCDTDFELMVGLNNTKPIKCSSCGSKKVSKKFSSCVFKLIGKGFYANDYANKGKERKRKTGK